MRGSEEGKAILQEAIEVVDRLNFEIGNVEADAALEGGPLVTLEFSGFDILGTPEICIMFGADVVWSLETDERKRIGVCSACEGSGEFGTGAEYPKCCPHCGGTGKDDPREPLMDFTRREIVKLLEAMTKIGAALVYDPVGTEVG